MRLFRVTLPVAAIDEAAGFYASVLAQDGKRIAPDRHSFDVGQIKLDCRQTDAGAPIPVPEPVCFAVHDLEGFRQRAGAAGASFELTMREGIGIPGAIEIRPWGERSFYCADPSGNALCFVAAGTERVD